MPSRSPRRNTRLSKAHIATSLLKTLFASKSQRAVVISLAALLTVVGGTLIQRSALLRAVTPAEPSAPTATVAFPMQAPVNGDGKIAFQTNRDGNHEVYLMNADGSGWMNLSNNLAGDYVPRWSPDGTKIVFYSNRDGDTEIFTMSADGTNQTQLTFNTASELYASWSPDDTRIAFSSYRNGGAEIYVMNTDGTNQVRLTINTATDTTPIWSPDGAKIAFATDRDGSANANYELYVMNADGTNPVRLTNSAGWDYAPDWSPNGSQILFQSQRDGNWELYKMSADGSNQVRLTSNSSSDTSARWSSDGTKIVFETNRNGMNQIFTMNADGSNQNAITDTGGRVYSPAWQAVNDFCSTESPNEATKQQTTQEMQAFAAGSYIPSAPGSIEIPIHFHVITESTTAPLEQELGYIPESKLVEQLDLMNAAYSGATGGVNTPFRFYIADITYTENTAWFDSAKASPDENAMKAALRCGLAGRLNIYIKSAPTGYGTFPQNYGSSDLPPAYDGVVIKWTTLPGGSQPNLNTGNVAVHEAGHWLGLFHTFEGGCMETSCDGMMGDGVCDTPAHERPNDLERALCSQPSDTCSLPGSSPVLNYMNYTLSTCWNQFTAGQSQRMDMMVQMYRPQIPPKGSCFDCRCRNP